LIMPRAILSWFASLLTLGLCLISLNAALRPGQSGGLDQAFLETRRALTSALITFNRSDREPLRGGAPR
jgi:hypothetical protein